MNNKLTIEIINHIFSGLGLSIDSNLDLNKFESIKNNKYLLPETVTFDVENKSVKNNVWGTQFILEGEFLKILAADCTTEEGVLGYAVLIHLQNNPSYGVYLDYSSQFEIDPQPLIAVTIDNKKWMPCNTYLQATFLAAMENVKQVGLKWEKCKDYNHQFTNLLTFIKYHNSYYEESN
jgi:hypothetical protein